jgi:flagellar hook protein FlgE
MAFQQGLSGLNAASQSLDVIGNNVANAATVGFKGSQAQFADVFAASLSGVGGVQVGIGVKVADIAQQFTQGNITVTNNPLDLAINGGGFFRLSDTTGAVTFSRNGQFHQDKDGFIVNATGQRLTGYDADAAGTIIATLTDLQFTPAKQSLTPQSTTALDIGMNLDSRKPVIAAAFDPNNTATYTNSTSASVFDSLGNSHTLSSYFVKTAANTWSVYGTFDGTPLGYVPPAAPVALGTLSFNSSGALTTAMPLAGAVSATLTNGATTPLVFDLNFTGSTQFGANFSVNTLTQDGFSSGVLAGVTIGSDGILLGRYTNGQSKNLGQVIMASFPNNNGLQPLGNNQWAESPDSGQPLVGTPGTGKLGVIQSSAVEESTTDLTAELVNMITAQRNYQANAQTIKVQDAILQTITNLR